jgi:hypothetical protein
MIEENVNLSLSNNESVSDTNISFNENVSIETSSPLPAAVTEKTEVTEINPEETVEKTKLRKALQEFSNEVSAVVFSDMSDRDAFALCRKLFRDLRMQKRGFFPINNQRKKRVKLKSKGKKGLLKLKGNKRNKK